MKSFLTAWLAEAPKVLGRELSASLELLPSARLPEPEAAVSLSVTVSGPANGRFLVIADRAALHELFVAARVTAGDADEPRDRELWRGILQQTAEQIAAQITAQTAATAAQSVDGARAAALSVSVEDASWTLGLPSAAYELRFGDTVMLLAFADEVKISEADAPKAARTSAQTSTTAAYSSPATGAKVSPGGIDLLLDVELETSLRFGSREMPLNELLELGAGDVVELDRHVSDPVDLLVGDKIVARGEVVLINGSFGLRVLEVAEPKKCLESIRCLF
ncbi:MAG: flagellar motor switch protein FliN [Silvibacterium sp.]